MRSDLSPHRACCAMGLALLCALAGGLTGYDNRDANGGKPDEEVYLYDAAAEGGPKQLVCVSCDPTGARPVGAFIQGGRARIENSEPHTLVDNSDIWQERWLAATIPGWTNVAEGLAFYQSRYLSDGGRLFLNSNDALVPQDTNGTWDVYEYEPAGVGDCGSTGESFVEAAGGCVRLISSGGSRRESVFLDASENGDDVFFLTSAGLAGSDYDGAPDVYDAHVCSPGSPCLQVSPVSPPPCSTGDSCKAAPSPQPEIFGAPSSETFSGTGNVTLSGVAPRVAARSLSGAQKLASALKACREKKKRGRKRVLCELQARKKHAKKAVVKSRVGESVSVRTGR